jgi:hypothetical protein
MDRKGWKGWERRIVQVFWRRQNLVLRNGFLEAGWQRTNEYRKIRRGEKGG